MRRQCNDFAAPREKAIVVERLGIVEIESAGKLSEIAIPFVVEAAFGRFGATVGDLEIYRAGVAAIAAAIAVTLPPAAILREVRAAVIAPVAIVAGVATATSMLVAVMLVAVPATPVVVAVPTTSVFVLAAAIPIVVVIAVLVVVPILVLAPIPVSAVTAVLVPVLALDTPAPLLLRPSHGDGDVEEKRWIRRGSQGERGPGKDGEERFHGALP